MGRNLSFYPDGARLTGVDWSPAMLGIARERAAALGRDADLRQGDAQALEFPDGSFDTVLCALGLCAIPDDRRAVTEMARVLRPGGRLLLVDHVAASAPCEGNPMYDATLAETVTIRGDGGDEIEAYLARPMSQGPLGGVVVIHHMPGYDPPTKEIARRFAAEGYNALMPNLYHRDAPGASPDDAAAAARAKGGVPDARRVRPTSSTPTTAPATRSSR